MATSIQDSFDPTRSSKMLKSTSDRDHAQLTGLGSKMTQAKSALYEAVKSGDPAKIKIAEMEFEEAASAFQAFANATKRMMDVIREIINNMR